jgi:hypothetical protein
LRVFADEKLRKAARIFMAVSTVAVLAVTFWAVFICIPVSASWTLGKKGTCGDLKVAYVVGCILGLANDTMTLLLPMPLIWHLNTKRSNKIRLQSLFAVGLR